MAWDNLGSGKLGMGLSMGLSMVIARIGGTCTIHGRDQDSPFCLYWRMREPVIIWRGEVKDEIPCLA
jgi:hypothetical protein